MTPDYDRATLFVASSTDSTPVEMPPPAVGDAVAMRRLRDPFAIWPSDEPPSRPQHRPV